KDQGHDSGRGHDRRETAPLPAGVCGAHGASLRCGAGHIRWSRRGRRERKGNRTVIRGAPEERRAAGHRDRSTSGQQCDGRYPGRLCSSHFGGPMPFHPAYPDHLTQRQLDDEKHMAAARVDGDSPLSDPIVIVESAPDWPDRFNEPTCSILSATSVRACEIASACSLSRSGQSEAISTMTIGSDRGESPSTLAAAMCFSSSSWRWVRWSG